MTALNVNTKPNKNLLIEIIGTVVYIRNFRADYFFSIPVGYYFIDSIIFHHCESIEVGVCKYDPEISLESVDADNSHIGYFNLDDLDITYPELSNNSSSPLINQ